MGTPTNTTVQCLDCGRAAVPVKRKANAAGRLYYVCTGKNGCGAKHDFDPELGEADLPAAFQPRRAAAQPEPASAPADPPKRSGEGTFDPFDPGTW